MISDHDWGALSVRLVKDVHWKAIVVNHETEGLKRYESEHEAAPGDHRWARIILLQLGTFVPVHWNEGLGILYECYIGLDDL